ncbi:MAG: hypothetical protein LBT26_01240 [Clostridiales Family XIII bacterium]|jgi:hypothetical protein|nr:hypothetical protein [Clostridiales Family XIII bacterium]
MVEMMLPEENDQIFAARYQTVLPSKEELRKALEWNDKEANDVEFVTIN